MSKRISIRLFLIACCLICISSVCSEKSYSQKKSLDFSNSEQVGFSPTIQTKIDDYLQGLVNDKKIAGVVCLIARKGKIVHFKGYGYRDIEKNLKMENDAIFKMASMTKPFTTVATMILYEEGYFKLEDPIANYIPELQNMKVGITTFDSSKQEYQLRLEDAKSEITIKQLLNHTAGFTASWYPGKIGQLYKEIESKDHKDLAAFMNDLCKVPLVHQPGTAFQYGFSSNILAYLIEKISNQTFEEFLIERIYKPLGLTSTGHNIPEEYLARVACYYYPEEGELKKSENQYTGERTTFCGGQSGILSTAEDYYKLCQMLLNGGTFNGNRLLKTSTIQLMTQLSMGQEGDAFEWFPGYSFGLGFLIRTSNEKAEMLGTLGEYCFGGAAGTAFWVDPREEIIGIVLTQAPHNFYIISKKMRDLVYQSLEK